MQLSSSFADFYAEHYKERGGTDHFVQLISEDLEALSGKLYVKLINPAAATEEAKIDFFFQNLNAFCRKQMSFQGFQRHPSPPLDVYEYHNIHNKLDIQRNRIHYSSLFK